VAYHRTANGKIFLAFRRAPLPELDGPELDRLERELDEVRRARFASAIDELEPGLAAIAVPVTGAHGDVIAAISITGPTLRMCPERIAELRPALREEAARLAARLGNRDHREKAA
jgi:DNA-binding IclR family transcriptional regulator